MAEQEAMWEPLVYGERYYLHTAKSNITSLGHVIAEAVSNADEAIRVRAERRAEENYGQVTIKFDPATRMLSVIDDGVGMTSEEMRSRMQRVGEEALVGAERSFFHRGIREVFIALGESVVESVALDGDGERIYQAPSSIRGRACCRLRPTSRRMAWRSTTSSPTRGLSSGRHFSDS